MAVFPDRIVLKNSTDSEAAILAAIGSGGSDEITQGEIVLRLSPGNLEMYSVDGSGDIVKFSPTSASGRAIVSETTPTVGLGGLPLADGDLWFKPSNESYHVYYTGAWVQVSGGSGGTGTVTSVGLNSTTLTTSATPVTTAGFLSVGLPTMDLVTPGSYTSANITVDSYGRVTQVSNGAGGGYTDPLSVDGQMVYRNGSTTALNIGSAGQVLTVVGGLPSWEDSASTGTVTSVNIADTDNIAAVGGPITDSGTFTIDLIDTGVVAGSYTSSNITVDSKGRITSISNGAGGGYADPLTTDGDIVIRSGGTTRRLGIGSAGQVLTVTGGIPVWETPVTGGTVTSVDVTGGTGLSSSGGPITSSGAITLNLTNTGVSAGSFTNPIITVDAQGRITAAANGSGGVVSIDDLSDVDTSTTLPTDGQALVWNNILDKWEPGTVSGGGGVDSVNGETGVVSLGIQDMDDFQLNLPDSAVVLRYDTFSAGGPTGSAGQAGSFLANNDRFIGNQFDSNGVDAIAEQGDAITANGGTDVNLPVWFSADGSNWTAATSTFSNYPGDFRFNSLTKVSDGTTLNLINDITSSGPIYLAMSDPDLPPTPLADGDILQWVAGESLFKPARITARSTASVTSSSLADGANENLAITGTGKAGQLLAIEVDQAAWVTVYCSQNSRTADAARLETEDPDPGSGVLAEIITTGAQQVLVTPAVNYFNFETVPATELYLKVTNKSGVSNTITTTLSIIPVES